jgi:hypothetical protein
MLIVISSDDKGTILMISVLKNDVVASKIGNIVPVFVVKKIC